MQSDWIELLRHTYRLLTDENTVNFQREMLAHNDTRFSLNVRDEIVGLEVRKMSSL